MKTKHNIEIYQKLESAAYYFLSSSMHNLENAMKEESKEVIFLEEVKNISVSEEEIENLQNIVFPISPVDFLQLKEKFSVTGQLMNELLMVMVITEKRHSIEKITFQKDHQVKSIEILGHLNNFGFFVETIINRHLLFLYHQNSIDTVSYSRISLAKIMERIIYLFKDELINDKIQLNEILNLFKLRNKTVHFTPDNAKDLNVKLSELFRIWMQVIKLLKLLEDKEKFTGMKFSETLRNYSQNFQIEQH